MYNHFVQNFVDAQTASLKHYGAIARIEIRLFGETQNPAVRAPDVIEIDTERRRVCETVADRIIEKARDQFAIGSARLVIHRPAIFRLANFDIDRSLFRGELPDFDRLWAVLQTQLRNIHTHAGEAQ